MSENFSHNCSQCSSECNEWISPKNLIEPLQHGSSVEKVIGIASGKGGVGKSLIPPLMAVLTKRAGYQTAILDADITGPSIPKIFGIHEKAAGMEDGILPAVCQNGLNMFLNRLIKETERA